MYMGEISITQIKHTEWNEYYDVGIEITDSNLQKLVWENLHHITHSDLQDIQEATCKQVFDILETNFDPQLKLPFEKNQYHEWVEKLKKWKDLSIAIQKPDLDTMLSATLILKHRQLLQIKKEQLIFIEKIVKAAALKDTNQSEYNKYLEHLKINYPQVKFNTILAAASQIIWKPWTPFDRCENLRECISWQISEEEIKNLAQEKHIAREQAETSIQNMKNIIPSSFSTVESEEGFATQAWYKRLKSEYVLAYSSESKKFTFGKNNYSNSLNRKPEDYSIFSKLINSIEEGWWWHIEKKNFIISSPTNKKSDIPIYYTVLLCALFIQPQILPAIKKLVWTYIKNNIFSHILDQHNDIHVKIKDINIITSHETNEKSKEYFKENIKNLTEEKRDLEKFINIAFFLMKDEEEKSTNTYQRNEEIETTKNKKIAKKIFEEIIYSPLQETTELYKIMAIENKIENIKNIYFDKYKAIILIDYFIKKYEEFFPEFKESTKKTSDFTPWNIYLGTIEKINPHMGVFIDVANNYWKEIQWLISKHKINYFEDNLPIFLPWQKMAVEFIKHKIGSNWKDQYDFKF